jgi:hypothetical protein
MRIRLITVRKFGKFKILTGIHNPKQAPFQDIYVINNIKVNHYIIYRTNK